MGVIVLVRHGQASFGEAEYDHLSELGKRQAEVLGTNLAERGIRPALVVTGALERQRTTGEHLNCGAGWTAPTIIDPAWDEYDHEDILAGYQRSAGDTAVPQPGDTTTDRRAFQQMFLAASRRWACGEHDTDYAEPFEHFSQRVETALTRTATDLGRGEIAVVVTSGGVMSWVAADLLTRPSGARDITRSHAPALSPGSQEVWLNLSSTVVNTAVTTVLVGTTLTVLDINNHAHLLDDTSLVTYR